MMLLPRMLMPRMLGLLLFLGCATAHDPASLPEDTTDRESPVHEPDGKCERRATVTVHVDNRSSMDVQISFGPYTPARAAQGLSRTTYEVSRYYLEGYIRLRIARGGLQVGTTPPVLTEPVVCNDATLIIGPRPRYSFFYGDEPREHRCHHRAGADEEALHGEPGGSLLRDQVVPHEGPKGPPWRC
jgi:hypothetical protein